MTEQSENASARTVVLQYTPDVQLETPKNLSVDPGYNLSWSSVPYAAYYRVKINSKYSSLKTCTAEGTSVNISSYCEGKEKQHRNDSPRKGR